MPRSITSSVTCTRSSAAIPSVRHRSEERLVRGLTEPLEFGNVYVRPLDFHNVLISDSYTFNPSTINEVRASPEGLSGGALRPNQILANSAAQPSDWRIGPHRFPFSAQERYFNFDAFAYPAAFSVGTLGRNTLESPGLRWHQVSLSKEFRITEGTRFERRWDINNVTKEPQFADPNTVFNTTNRSTFGTFNGTRGSLSRSDSSRRRPLDGGKGIEEANAVPARRTAGR